MCKTLRVVFNQAKKKVGLEGLARNYFSERFIDAIMLYDKNYGFV